MHLKHLDGSNEKVPYFCLPANELNDVIAPSCYSCFDYPNALADLVRSALRGHTGLEHELTACVSISLCDEGELPAIAGLAVDRQHASLYLYVMRSSYLQDCQSQAWQV